MHRPRPPTHTTRCPCAPAGPHRPTPLPRAANTPPNVHRLTSQLTAASSARSTSASSQTANRTNSAFALRRARARSISSDPPNEDNSGTIRLHFTSQRLGAAEIESPIRLAVQHANGCAGRWIRKHSRWSAKPRPNSMACIQFSLLCIRTTVADFCGPGKVFFSFFLLSA